MSSPRAFTYMHLTNVKMIEHLYAQFLQDPFSVDSSWRYFFEGVEFGSYRKNLERAPDKEDLRIYQLIDAYRRLGHLQARTLPVTLNTVESIPELMLSNWDLKETELNTLFSTWGLLNEERAPLSQIIEVLQTTYCGSKAVQYMGFHSKEMEKWIQSRIEPHAFSPNFSIVQKKKILDFLNKSELFEIFLHTKYVGQKRFSLEGEETLIPMLHAIIEKGTELGMDECVTAMSHRGRLNVLANIMNKSFSMIFSEFEDYHDPHGGDALGDVKYHKGFSATLLVAQGKQVHISLLANASHLESVDPIAEGKTKAKQEQRRDKEQKKVMPILIHGDASFAGQGVVYETLQMSKLKEYSTGGTVHIVINNHIGFTTLPSEYQSSQYCTDIALAFGFPVFHVNAEDPEGCIFAAQIAVELRYLFKCDVFIELNGFRKYGHNESDEPFFTQPLEYQLIRNRKSIREIYRDHLIHQGVIEKDMALQLEEEFKQALHFELEELKITKEASVVEAFGSIWSNYRRAKKEELFVSVSTAVDLSILQAISECITKIPSGFEIHKKLFKLVDERNKMGVGKKSLDWAMAEHLAFGSLLWEDVHVRLAGQDCQRGTFTQRHAVWVDQNNGTKYFPLSHLKEQQGCFTVVNSLLSEYAGLGFEYGYSLAYPDALILWEAQFGDFANGAQIIFDQYLSASARKWQRYSGLVVLLPHGYEGQGPEHSSGRLERFLQLAAESNIQITNPTTPSQYFHLLRRQVKRNIRIPLIVFTPKGLLRHSECVSPLEELSTGGFQEILEDPKANYNATKVLFCTGRIYYDLSVERLKRSAHHIAILRVEQLYPLDYESLDQIFNQYKIAQDIFWIQEEPRNMGAFAYMESHLKELFPTKNVHYLGRHFSASTATGSHRFHKKEYEQLMDSAFL